MDSGRSRKLRSSKKHVSKKGKKSDDADMADMDNDSDSGSTIASSICSEMSDEGEPQAGVDEVGNDVEQILLDSIEGATAKSAKERQTSLKEIKKVLSMKFLPDFVDSRKDTLLDIIERCLKRGQPADKTVAATLSSILCVQLGDANSRNVYLALKPLLITTLNDNSCAASVRASCASALGMCCFIGSEELQEVIDCLGALQGIFAKKLKDGSAEQVLYSNAVMAWGLLLTVASATVQQEAIDLNLERLCTLLENDDLNLRIAAGEVIALIYELGRDVDENFDAFVSGLYDLLKELATDSSRYKAKREKKQQRSIFRDILKTVENGTVPAETVKFGSEQVDLDSWTKIRQYNAMKECLGSGVTSHLQENLLLRQIFDLGAPVLKQEPKTKEGRWEKSLQNAAAHKERTKLRSKGRENKRAAHGL